MWPPFRSRFSGWRWVSVARSMTSARSFHRFFSDEEGLTAADPAADVQPPKIPQRLPQGLTVEEVNLLLDVAGIGEGPVPLRDRALLEFLYGTGARISEAVDLNIDDLDTRTRQVRLFGKGRKERVLPLGTYAIEALEAYLVRGRPELATRGSGTPAVFLNTRGRKNSCHRVLGNLARRGRTSTAHHTHISSQPATFLCHPPAGGWSGRADRPGNAGPFFRHHHADLYTRQPRHGARGLCIVASSGDLLGIVGA